MRIGDITSHLSETRRAQIGEALRFACVGIIAVLLQYAVYWALTKLLGGSLPKGKSQFCSSVFMTVAYAVSFVFNFIASTRFTFRVKASVRRGAGFAFSHMVNWLMQMMTLNLFLWLGLDEEIAPIPMFAVCVPMNFMFVRYFLKVRR